MHDRSLASVLAIVCGVFSVLGIVAGAPAGASCAGPMLEPIEPVVRGEAVTISGAAFGTDCYDTGPPPEGIGVLGPPIEDLEIALVQGGDEVVLARGGADADYEFTVDVTVPPGFSAGPARVVARWKGAGGGSTEQPVEIRSDPPAAAPTSTTAVASFGPDDAAPAADDRPEEVSSAEEGPNPLVRGVAALLVVGLGAVLVVSFRRRRGDRSASSSDR